MKKKLKKIEQETVLNSKIRFTSCKIDRQNLKSLIFDRYACTEIF